MKESRLTHIPQLGVATETFWQRFLATYRFRRRFGRESWWADRYQMLKRGSPVFEMASAIQARALALSAVRSAREGALSLSPPAVMYCRAILPSNRQFSELSYFS